MAVDDPGHLTPSTGGQPKRWRSSEQVLLDGQDRLYVAEEAPARVSRHTLDSDESEELYTAEDDSHLHMSSILLVTGYNYYGRPRN